MKKSFKARLLSVALAFAFVCSIVPVMGLLKTNRKAFAESVSNSNFYFQKLTDYQKGIYNAINTAHANGVFQSGGSVDLISSGAVSSADVREYSQGNSKVIKDFNIAKDAYMFDHPELFYVDFEKLSLSLGSQNNGYVAVVDSGKYANYFYESLPQGGVSLALSNFNGANGVNKFVQGTASTQAEKVVMVSRNITNAVVSTDEGAYATAYSAFNGRANAEGYAKLLKACLDRINIPCLVVYGYLASESDYAVSKHCFNYVQIEGRWLAVDLYLNELTSSEKYTLVRAEKFEARHIVSNSVFGSEALEIPELESFKFEKSYTKQNLILEITYNGLNASQLLYHEELYIVQILSELGETMPAKALFDDVLQSSQIIVDGSHASLIYAVTATAPDEGTSYASLSQDDLIAVESFANEVKTFDDTIRPFIDVVKVENQTEEEIVYEFGSSLKMNDSWHIEFMFDEDLKKIDEEITFKVSVDGKDITSQVEISNIVWSDAFAKTISFDFVPSKAFAHQGRYCFEVVGLVSGVVNNDTTKPRPVYIDFENENINFENVSASSAVFELVNQPKLEVMADVELLSLKWANGSSATGLKNQDLVLMTQSVDSNVLNKQSVAGENAKFFNVSLVAKQKQLLLNDNLVSIIFPKSENKDLSAKVYLISEDGETATLVDSVVTENGVVVSTSTLGNFKVVYCEVDAESKMIEVKQTNSLGKISIVGKSSLICSVSGSVQISVSCLSGYEVDFVILNGKDITSKLSGGKVQLTSADLAECNTVQISFISSQKKLINAQNNFSSLDGKFFANQQLEFVPTIPDEAEPTGLSKGVLLIIIVGAWLVLCGGIVLVVVLLKKKPSNPNDENKTEQKEEQE